MCVGLVVVIAGLVLLPAAARAQTLTSGSIAGVAQDISGAVLPGVTVEASSPALIEKVRGVVTDGSGQYKIVDLRPGLYTVTFSLGGFSTVKREGIELTTGFTATVNAEMKVGELAETVTVTGASPIVDTQNVRRASVLANAYLAAVPTAANGPGLASLILGAVGIVGDVGGSKSEQATPMSIHGGRPNDQMLMLDGMRYQYMRGGGGGMVRGVFVNQLGAQELVVETSGMSAESETGGVQQNVIPKDGGNTFQLSAIGNYSGPSLGTSGLTDALRDRGLTSTNSIKRIYDAGAAMGGPIMKDRLWWFSGQRWWGAGEYVAGNWFNKSPNPLFYTPDLSRPAFFDTSSQDHSVRLSWQAAPKQKFTYYQAFQHHCACYQNLSSQGGVGTVRSPEAASSYHFGPSTNGYNGEGVALRAIILTQGTWTYPATNRLLFQAGISHVKSPWNVDPSEGVDPYAIAVTEQSTGYLYGATAGGYSFDQNDALNLRASTSYVTGSHAFKVGLFFFKGVPLSVDDIVYGSDVSYTFRTPSPGAAPVPISVTEYSLPFHIKEGSENLGLYAQDQWTLRKLTLNMGVRFDALHAWSPAVTRPGGRFVPEISLPFLDNTPLWRDVSPRLGGAYDLFGNGKTAIKGSLGRYVIGEATSLAVATSPASAVVRSATRVWTDSNGDYIPQESELGALSNSAFGTVAPNIQYTKEVLQGFGVRPYDWQTSVGLQQELRPGMGLNIDYFRTWYGRFRTTDNLNVTPADYSPFCVTAPVDPRLPGGGGNQICGQYDITPTAFGSVNNLVTDASHYGKATEVFNGVEAGLNVRFGRGGMINGGAFRGKTVVNNCYVVDSPQQLYQCQVPTPTSQVKINGAYPLPWDLQASWVYQNLQGTQILANLPYTNAQIAPSLGRNLGQCRGSATCNGTATVSLIDPGTQFEARYTQLDLRLTKTFRMGGRARLKTMADAYNVLGGDAVVTRNDNYGPNWGKPTVTQLGRVFKFGTQLDW
jgi:hypothetical protein